MKEYEILLDTDLMDNAFSVEKLNQNSWKIQMIQPKFTKGCISTVTTATVKFKVITSSKENTHTD